MFLILKIFAYYQIIFFIIKLAPLNKNLNPVKSRYAGTAKQLFHWGEDF